jgi:hypothetical protein
MTDSDQTHHATKYAGSDDPGDLTVFDGRRILMVATGAILLVIGLITWFLVSGTLGSP